jgi:hypothetical protein
MAREINPRLKNLARMTSNPNASVPKLEEKLNDVETGDIEELRGFIYVPSIKLYVAKEKSLFGKNWFEAHEELGKNGLGMLTLKQFFKFIFYLNDNKKKMKEADQILDDIFSKKRSWKAEWLDARFTREGTQLFLNYDHRVVNGSIIDYKKEPLLKCLMEDGHIDMASTNRQGLPTVPGEHINYWYPREKSVALFYTDPVWVYLSCFRNPETADSYIGVRMTCKK